MTTSDLERALAEARAAAARRLEGLKRLEAARPEHADDEPCRETQPGPYAAPEPKIMRVGPQDIRPAAGYGLVTPRGPADLRDGYLPVDDVRRDRAVPQTASGVMTPLSDAAARAVPAVRAFAVRIMWTAASAVKTFRENRAQRRAIAQAQGAARIPRPEKQRLTAKERRWERRRRRHFYEEILGWILVPTILVSLYFAGLWVIGLLGMTPEDLMDGIRTIRAQFS